MKTNELVNTLRDQLIEIKPALPQDLPAQDDLRQAWGLDSLELVEFVARIEQGFNIMIPDQDLSRLSSLASAAGYIQQHRER